MDLETWLKGLGLGQYAGPFADQHIDADILRQLTADDLKELGVASLGHRKRLLAAIAGLGGPAVEAAAPQAAAPPAGERRQVTILFADLCGFTALSRVLDAEELHALIGRYNALVDGIVEDYGGTVDKHIGDAVMALFGAPLAHGDDTLRAVRAALDIHVAVASLGAEFGRVLEAHLGVASGEVVAGGLGRAGRQDYTVLGESVNLAARLVGVARPGQTVISDAVYRALAGRAECEDLGEVTVKGIDTSVRVWCVRALLNEGGLPRSPFVGRRTELAQFKGVIDGCLAAGAGQAIYIRGEAGIGKTRLLAELTRLAAEHGFARHHAAALDFGAGKGQDPVRSLVRSLLEAEPGGGKDSRRAAAERAIAEGLISATRRVFLDDLLDLPHGAATRALYDAMDNAARNRGKRELVAGLVEAASRRQPLLILVEDLHWADALTLSHLAGIAAAVRNSPALLVMTSRLEGDPLDAAWRSSAAGTPLTTIDLGPLRQEEAMTLAGAFIDATQRMALDCIARAEGNPLFLEQLLRNAEEGADDAVPPSIQSLVLARMDRLALLDKQALQAASVVGQRFDLATLRHLLGAADYACAGLIEHALVRPDGEAYLFGHALIKEGVYSSMLKPRRRELHRLAAEWFAGHDPALRAQHLDRAGDDAAPRAYCEAAEAHKAGYHYERAMQLIDRGLALAVARRDRHALGCLKGDLLHDLGSVAELIETFRQALDFADDDEGRCRVWIGLAAGLRVSEGLAEALELLDKAEAAATSGNLVAELARLHHLRGNIFFPLGRIEGCVEQHELGLRFARQSGSPEAEARSLGGLADAAYAQGRMRTAFGHFSRCVALSREHGFGRIEVANRSMVGFSRFYLNQLREGVEDGVEAARAASAVGHARAEMLGETMAAMGCYETAEFDRALAHIERGLRLAHALGAGRFEAQFHEFEGRVLLGRGSRAAAAQRLTEALELCRAVGLQFSGPKTIVALALATDDPATRRSLLDEAQELLRRGTVGHNHLLFYRDAMEVSLAAADWNEALRYAASLEDYTSAEPLPWSDLFIARARAIAAVYQGKRDAAVGQELARIAQDLSEAGLRMYRPAVDAALGLSGG